MVGLGRIWPDSGIFGLGKSLPEATPTKSDCRIPPDLVGLGQIRPDFVKLGWIWLYRICLDLVGFGRIGFGSI